MWKCLGVIMIRDTPPPAPAGPPTLLRPPVARVASPPGGGDCVIHSAADANDVPLATTIAVPTPVARVNHSTVDAKMRGALTPEQESAAIMVMSIFPSASREACCQALKSSSWQTDQAVTMLLNLDPPSIQQLEMTWRQGRKVGAVTGAELPEAKQFEAAAGVVGISSFISTTSGDTASGDTTSGERIRTVFKRPKSTCDTVAPSSATCVLPQIVATGSPSGDIKSGDAVRVKPSCQQPVNGWGKVKRNEVGTVILADGDTLIIDFPSENGTAWLGSRGDIETVAVHMSKGSTSAAQTSPEPEASVVAHEAECRCSSNNFRVLLVGRAPAAGDKVRLLATGEIGDVLVVDKTHDESDSIVTAIFASLGGAPWVGSMAEVETVQVAASPSHVDASAAEADANGWEEFKSSSGPRKSRPSEDLIDTGSSIYAQSIDAAQLEGVDPATRAMLQQIMLEEQEMNRNRREAARARNNAEIAGSAAFGLKTDILDLKKRGPKIRVRKKMVLPREWAKHNDTEDAMKRRNLEDRHLFAVALFDKSELSGGRGMRTVAAQVQTEDAVTEDAVVCIVTSEHGIGYRSSLNIDDRYNTVRGPEQNDRVSGVRVDPFWLRVEVPGGHGTKYLPIVDKQGSELLRVVPESETLASGGESKLGTADGEREFKSGDVLLVSPPSGGGPWWRLETVIDLKTTRELNLPPSRGPVDSVPVPASSLRQSSESRFAHINRNFVQPLVCFYRLRRHCLEYRDVKDIFESALQAGGHTGRQIKSKMRIRGIDRIQNRDLWEGFYRRLDRVEESSHGNSDVRLMYFCATNAAMVLSIALQGFDWRIHAAIGGSMTGPNAPRSDLGQGFYFDTKAERAHAEAVRWPGKESMSDLFSPGKPKLIRHMIVSRVCCGRSVAGSRRLRRPPAGFHSSQGDGGKRVVVFDSVQAYPQWHIEYVCVE